MFNAFYCFTRFVNKHFTNFSGIQLENSHDQECEIFKVVFLYEDEHIERFSNLY